MMLIIKVMPGRFLLPATLVLLALAILPAVHLAAPPRFDETGYAILARSLAEGRGYREIDKPTAPSHAHFPPGWPLALAAVWSVVPGSVVGATQSAHWLTIGLWLISLYLWQKWFRQVCPGMAGALFMALGANWLWIRLAGELRSESLFLAISAAVILVLSKPRPDTESLRALGVGLLISFGILTRQVGVALAVAVFLELFVRKAYRTMFFSAMPIVALVGLWLAWQQATGAATQAELFTKDELARSLTKRLMDQALFYTRRLPDSLFGPFVEMATVFSRNHALAALCTALAIGFTAVLLVGMGQLLSRPATRLAGLYWCTTMAILLVWPFTEAGRFLIPLVPVGLLATMIGCQTVVERARPGFSHQNRLAWLLAALAVPFGLYTWQKNLRTTPEMVDFDFDTACQWIAQNVPSAQFIAARHPGDVYWRTGHRANFWPNASTVDEAAAAMKQKSLQYLLVDHGRFVGDTVPGWMMEDQLSKRPDLFQLVHTQGSKEPRTALWKLAKPAAP